MINQAELENPGLSQPNKPSTTGNENSLNLAKLLRIIGAGSLLAAISIFLLQGWEDGNDIYRYLLLLGHTAGLTILGFASGHCLKESKGARLLIMIALASVPANFAIMGAFLYSQFGSNPTDILYPSMAHWQAGDLRSALALGLASVVVLSPLVYLGFMVLSRKSAKSLSLLFLISNAAVLAPVRDPLWISIIILGLLLLLSFLTKSFLQNDTGLKTFEGFIAKALIFSPVAVIAGRNIWIYAADGFMFASVAALVYVLLRQICMQLNKNSVLRHLLELNAAFAAVAFSGALCFVMLDIYSIRDTWIFPLFPLVLSLMLFELSSWSGRSSKAMRRTAIAVLSLGMIANLFFNAGTVAAAVALLTGLTIIVYGYISEQRVAFSLGLITLLSGLVYQIAQAISGFDLGSWSSLALLGIGAILISSLIERHGGQLKLKVNQWGKQVKSWKN